SGPLPPPWLSPPLRVCVAMVAPCVMAWRCFMVFAQEGGPLDEDAVPAPDPAGAAAAGAAGPSGATPNVERAPLRKFDRSACPDLSAILRNGETAALPALASAASPVAAIPPATAL